MALIYHSVGKRYETNKTSTSNKIVFIRTNNKKKTKQNKIITLCKFSNNKRMAKQ